MKRWSVILLILATSGCASFNSEFDCPAVKGVGCKRLSAINEDYNAQKGIVNNETAKKVIYAKGDYIDIHLKGYEDEKGIYHHPRKITVKA